jgi:predicted MFS family arabinose efflux permease
VFLLGGGMMAVLLAVLYRLLPVDPPSFTGSYGSLMKSLVSLVKTYRPLRQAALTSFLTFGAFSVFWTTLVFLLEGSPFFYKSDMVGLFGLIGACGALAAPAAGKSADSRGPQFTLRLGVMAMLAAFVIMGFSAASLTGLIVGVILLDIGQQVTHISNQSKVFALLPQARSRLNTVYMTSAFSGGALGSLLGAQVWSHWQWTGVCFLGGTFVLAAFLLNFQQRNKTAS